MAYSAKTIMILIYQLSTMQEETHRLLITAIFGRIVHLKLKVFRETDSLNLIKRTYSSLRRSSKVRKNIENPLGKKEWQTCQYRVLTEAQLTLPKEGLLQTLYNKAINNTKHNELLILSREPKNLI